jgi:hypothetical protein
MPTVQLSLFQQYHADDPSLSDEQVIARICAQMLRDGDAVAPVDVDLLASVCGIDEIRYARQLWAGMLFQERGRLIASISALDGLERRRFTVLHEGGHTFLPGFLRARQHRCKGPKTRQEQLCDVAAAEMLFPRDQFIADLVQTGGGLATVESLAERYVASIQATALRSVTLADEPTMLLSFHYAHKPSERGREGSCPRKLRLEWSAGEGRWPYPLPHKSVAVGSPILGAWEHAIVAQVAEIDELFADPLGAVRVEARRYGDRVLAILRPPLRRRC